MYVSLPACAQRVTVFGSTWNIFAASVGVSSSVASSSPAEGFSVVAFIEGATFHCGGRGANAPAAACFRTGRRHRLIGRIGVLVGRRPCPATVPRLGAHDHFRPLRTPEGMSGTSHASELAGPQGAHVP